ncbi:MAG: HesA/MoeB/ThiF family protein [Magnetococcales bacterium]|nr:HesA/MoeB/ThiF family protein [Magnetococcales bacterium]NGZ06053.1 HesA/MoeB/ThiF family protein [Magnetococcales bacterium]
MVHLTAKVFVLGAGGLGAPVALFLAQAGIRHLVIADSDQVELSNLHRQIVHTTSGLGQPKAISARHTLTRLQPGISITAWTERITEQNIHTALSGCDLVVDGSDNFASRHLVNRACLSLGLPLISGAVLGWEGQVATFYHGVNAQAPCYRCLHPEITDSCVATSLPTCASAGVAGPAAGMIGALQAMAAMRVLTGQPMDPTLFLVNLHDQLFLRITIPKDPACPVCGPQP